MLIPTVLATALIVSRKSLWSSLSFKEFHHCMRHLMSMGVYGQGFSLAYYCKLQAPLLILDALNLPTEITKVGIISRFSVLLISGLSILSPLFFVRIGNALQKKDWTEFQFWTHLGLGVSAGMAIIVGGVCFFFGPLICKAWTGGIVNLDQFGQIVLAVYCASLLFQYLLLAVSAPDSVTIRRVRWLFWVEALAVPAIGALGALYFGGSGMLGGMGLVMALTVSIQFVVILRRVSSERTGNSGRIPGRRGEVIPLP